tara:strand:- start:64 stop:687 length:624 start_codon:yes stop_codon:yes gene_type:complete
MKAIETRYKGYRFRSRLEARWAVLFDQLNIQWDYELEGYHLSDGTMYLPDFYLKDLNIFIEIKGKEANQKELQKLSLLAGEINPIDLFITADGRIQKDLIEKYIEQFGGVELLNSNDGEFFSDKDKYNMAVKHLISHVKKRKQCIMFDRGLDGYGWLCGKKDLKDTASIEIDKFNVITLLAGDYSREKVLMAFNAAKSARFEHGENG